MVVGPLASGYAAISAMGLLWRLTTIVPDVPLHDSLNAAMEIAKG